MAVTKDQLKAGRGSKGGTVVRIIPKSSADKHMDAAYPYIRRDTYVVVDLMNRKSYDEPGRVGIGPVDMGLAFSVPLTDIEAVS